MSIEDDDEDSLGAYIKNKNANNEIDENEIEQDKKEEEEIYHRYEKIGSLTDIKTIKESELTKNYDNEGNSLSDSNIVISAYKISLDGTSENVPLFNNFSKLHVVAPGLTCVTDPSNLSEGVITFQRNSTNIPYNANGYDVTLYNGNFYADGPEHIDCIKDGAPGGLGNDGQDSVVYNLEPYPTVLKFNVAPDGKTLTPSELVARCNISKTIGNTSTIYDSTIDGYYMYYNITLSNGTIINISNSDHDYVNYSNSSGSSGIVVSNLNTNYTSVNFYLSKPSSSDLQPGEIIKQVSIPILRDGLKGESGEDSTGQVGKFYYFAGDWTGNSLTVTEHQYPYVYHNGDYFMYVGEPSPNNTTENPTNNQVVWEKITYNKFLISEAMFAKYAQLGALIVNRDWMISQYGTYDGSPSWSAYVKFDPIAFMTYLRPNEGASIGVIPYSYSSSSGIPCSQLFQIRQNATISVTVSGTTKLVKVSDYRQDNSQRLESYNEIFTFNGSGNTTISNPDANAWYCFIDGNVSDIKVKYSNVNSVFIPNYAVDLRSGFVYQNNAYIKGEVYADSGEFTGVMHSRQGDFDQLLSVDSKVGITGTSISNYYWRGIAIGLNPLMTSIPGNSPTNLDYATLGARFDDSTSDQGYGYSVLGGNNGSPLIIMEGRLGTITARNFLSGIRSFTGSTFNISELDCKVIDEHSGDSTLTLPNMRNVIGAANVSLNGFTVWIYKKLDGWARVYDNNNTEITKLSKDDGWHQIVYHGGNWYA